MIEIYLSSLSDTHLGLDLEDMQKVEMIAKEVLKHIDTDAIECMASVSVAPIGQRYPFKKIEKQNKKLVIVNDKNFSFLYHDNEEFLKEVFEEVVFIDSTKDEKIPQDADVIYIVGGYVERDVAFARVQNSHQFRDSLKNMPIQK